MAKNTSAPGADGAAKALPRPKRQSVPRAPAAAATDGAGKMPPIEEGRKRAFVDLQLRHYEYLERYAGLLAADKRRPQSVSDALEHIVRHTMMLDQTKAGQFVNAATVPAAKA